MVMRGLGKALNIEHGKGGVGDRLAKDELGVGLKSSLELSSVQSGATKVQVTPIRPMVWASRL